MFLTKKLCFIELEKTAVNYIRESFQANMPDGKIVGAHNFIDKNMINSNLIFIGSIRNPYDWYISRWSYGCFRKLNDSLYKNFIKKRLRFSRNKEIQKQNLKKIFFFFNQLFKSKKYWEDLYKDSEDPTKFKVWLNSLLLGKRTKDLAEHYYFSSLYKKFGYLTYRYLVMFTLPEKRKFLFDNTINSYSDLKRFDKENNYITKFIKFENLDSDINQVFNMINIKFENRLAKLNESKRLQNIDYYFDSETKSLVEKSDKFIFEKHNYFLK